MMTTRRRRPTTRTTTDRHRTTKRTDGRNRRRHRPWDTTRNGTSTGASANMCRTSMTARDGARSTGSAGSSVWTDTAAAAVSGSPAIAAERPIAVASSCAPRTRPTGARPRGVRATGARPRETRKWPAPRATAVVPAS